MSYIEVYFTSPSEEVLFPASSEVVPDWDSVGFPSSLVIVDGDETGELESLPASFESEVAVETEDDVEDEDSSAVLWLTSDELLSELAGDGEEEFEEMVMLHADSKQAQRIAETTTPAF